MSTIMIEILKFWFIFSFSLGCLTCLNLIISRKGDRQVKNTIIGLIILLLSPPLNSYINLANMHSVHWLAILTQKLTWCYGPIMVAVINHILLRPVSRYSYAIQALPFLFSLVHDALGLQLISFQTTAILLFLQVFGYLTYAGYLLKSQRSRILTITKQFKNTTYYWLIYLVCSLFIIMLCDVTVFVNLLLGNIPSFILVASVASLVAIFVNTIALFSIYQPQVFFHDINLQEEPTTEPKMQLRSIELTPEAAKQLDEQLMELVKNHKPHLDEDISLPKLASLLGVTSHQLSELFNIHKSTSFYDFLNDLRYKEAIHFLNNSDQDLTVSDIAYRSGFNNRNSFYKVFKEKTGQTPLQYKKANG